MKKAIGIDLGTTNCCMAVLVDGNPVIILNEEGERTTPSLVAFTNGKQRLIGLSAAAATRQSAGHHLLNKTLYGASVE